MSENNKCGIIKNIIYTNYMVHALDVGHESFQSNEVEIAQAEIDSIQKKLSTLEVKKRGFDLEAPKELENLENKILLLEERITLLEKQLKSQKEGEKDFSLAGEVAELNDEIDALNVNKTKMKEHRKVLREKIKEKREELKVAREKLSNLQSHANLSIVPDLDLDDDVISEQQEIKKPTALEAHKLIPAADLKPIEEEEIDIADFDETVVPSNVEVIPVADNSPKSGHTAKEAVLRSGTDVGERGEVETKAAEVSAARKHIEKIPEKLKPYTLDSFFDEVAFTRVPFTIGELKSAIKGDKEKKLGFLDRINKFFGAAKDTPQWKKLVGMVENMWQATQKMQSAKGASDRVRALNNKERIWELVNEYRDRDLKN